MSDPFSELSAVAQASGDDPPPPPASSQPGEVTTGSLIDTSISTSIPPSTPIATTAPPVSITPANVVSTPAPVTPVSAANPAPLATPASAVSTPVVPVIDVSVGSLSTDIPTFIKAVSSCLETWKTVNLDEQRSTLDKQGFDIADQQEASMRARKGLAESTKAFKKTPTEEKATAFGPLLKAYQQEIDRLTKRSKAAEGAFLTLYKSLYDAPDPVPLLSQAVEYSRQLDKVLPEKAKAEQALKDLKEDLGDIRNQEVTVRELESKLAQAQGTIEHLQSQAEDSIRQQVEVKMEAVMQSQHDMVSEYQETEKALTAQLKDAQDALVVVQARNDAYQAQLLELKSQHDEQQEALAHETELLASDLDSANARVAALERELESVRNGVSGGLGTQVGDNVGGPGSAAAAAAAVAAEELAQLQQELQNRDATLQRTEDRLTDLENSLADSEAQVRALQAQLDSTAASYRSQLEQVEADRDARPTQEELKQLRREVQSLKAVQFNFLSTEEGGSSDSDARGTGKDLGSLLADHSLEALLTMKNQKLESEVTTLRRELNTVSTDLQAVQRDLAESQAQAKVSAELVAKLEQDLADSDPRHGARSARSGADSPMPTAGTGGVNVTGDTSGDTGTITSSPAAPIPVTTSTVGSSETLGSVLAAPDPFQSAVSQSAPSADDARFAIVCEQRDRFRRRVTTLEEDNGRLQDEMKKISQEVKSLRTDNISLYEKIRYLENYRHNLSSGGIGSHSSGAGERARLLEDGGDPNNAEERYGQMYEEKMNPFNEFNRRERERRYGNLNAAERLTLSGSRFFLSNKYSRMFLFGYSLFLHIMVFFILYRYTHDAHDCYHASKEHID